MIIGSVASVSLALAGAATSGLIGTVRGLALAAWIAGGVSWWELRGAMRESPAVRKAMTSQLAGSQPAGPAGREQGQVAAAPACAA